MIRLSGLIDLKKIIEEEEKWIQKAIEKPGSLKKQLGVPEDETIPVEKLKAAAEKGGKLGKRARLAMTLRKLHEMGHIDEEKYNEMYEKLDPVGQEDADIDNDGDVDDSDEYLKHRRDVISKNIEKEKVNEDRADYELDEDDYDDAPMARAQLHSIHKRSGDLFNMIGDNDELEAWMQSKLTKAADYINAVFNALEYEKSATTSMAPGLGGPADMEEGKPSVWAMVSRKR